MTDSNGTIAFLFPGQGSQAVGMGKELAAKYPLARQTFAEADEALGYKLSQLCFEGPEEQLRLTEITQPAILTVSIAALRVLDLSLDVSARGNHDLFVHHKRKRSFRIHRISVLRGFRGNRLLQRQWNLGSHRNG